ncbi:MAG: YabP/YqfC family sporulation protein [Gemmiger sp.]
MLEPHAQETPAAPPGRDPAPCREHVLLLENRSRLTVSGVTRVVSCDESGATLKTSQGDLTIGGQGIQVSELSVRTGQVNIAGKIEFLQYAENRQTAGGLLARLLRG